MQTSRHPLGIVPVSLLLGLITFGTAAAQSRNSYPETDFRYDGGQEIRQTVGRISFLSGPVSFARGDEPDNWQAPAVNVPVTLGDRLYTGRRGRAEIQIHGGATVRLNSETDLAALNLTDDTKQLSLNSGVAAFLIRRLHSDEIFEVDTPNSAITFERRGDYRVDVDPDGFTRVAVRRGLAVVAAGGGQVTLNAGDQMSIDGIEDPRYDIDSLVSSDSFDRWVTDRESRIARTRSSQYVNDDIVGVADLDDYGRWEDIPEYGHVWSPASLEVGWAPYRVGHWVWQDPWGWTWVSGEPWGWAPYHYGRWVTSSSRWYWVPDAPRVSVRYSPALVAFVGGGSGFSATVRSGGPSFVGWFPLAPRDPFNPWWGRRSGERVDRVDTARYVNRSYVTVVNQNTFISGGLVARSVVTDRNVLRDVVSAPVLRGPLPVVPTRDSLRGAVRPDAQAPVRPPAAILERQVVARIAPPPPPPMFSAKVDAIRQNRGAPVTADVAARLVERRAPAPIVAIRPVAAEPGRITLSPGRSSGGNATGSTPEPVPVAPPRGRPLATTDRPYAFPSNAQSPAVPPAAGSPGSAPPPPVPDRSNERGRRPVPRDVPPVAAVPPPSSPDRPRAIEKAPPAPPDRGSDQRPGEDWRQRPAQGSRPGDGTPPTPGAPPQRGRGRDSAPSRPDSPPPPARAQERERPAAPPPSAAPAPDGPAPPPAPAERGRRRDPAPPENAPPPRGPERDRPVPNPTAAPAAQAPAPPPAPERGRGRDAGGAPPAARDDAASRRPAERERAPVPPAQAPPAAAAPPAPPERGRPAPQARQEQTPAAPDEKEKPKKDQKKEEKPEKDKDKDKDKKD
ncbi:MAG: DUF6600 domain-containing protein [Acidobacteriota bacterium]